MGRDSRRLGRWERALFGDSAAGKRQTLQEHESVGIVRCRLESHSALERKPAAVSARDLARSRQSQRSAATRLAAEHPTRQSSGKRARRVVMLNGVRDAIEYATSMRHRRTQTLARGRCFPTGVERGSVLEARVLARAPRSQRRRGALGSTQGPPISTGRAEAATPQADWTSRQDR
jgi:hypothetical protein